MFDGIGRVHLRQHLRIVSPIVAFGGPGSCGDAVRRVAPFETPTLAFAPTATAFVVPPPATALPGLITGLRTQGFTFVTSE